MYDTYYPVTYYFYPLLDGALEQHPAKADWQRVFHAPAPSGTEALLYVHIPYCQDLCRFCPFHVRVDKGDEVYRRYTNALIRHIREVSQTTRSRSLSYRAVYFGGGSPSVLSPEMLDEIYTAIRESFDLVPDAEISFEGEPKTLGDPARLDVLRKHGTHRISFGLQTYDQELRRHFNIAATLEDIERVRVNGREWGFDEINVDMMYNLPGQTVASLQRDIARLVEDDFDSIDYYNLHYFAFPPKFMSQMKSGAIPAKPSDNVMLALAEELRFQLAAAGYRNVADQVYSRKPRVCEYFRLLWGGGNGQHAAETVAVGSSSRGYMDGFAYMNHGNVNRYMEAIEQGGEVVEKISSRLAAPENRGAVLFPKFLQIDKRFDRALGSVDKSWFERMVDAGYFYETDDAWRISERGKLWVNNMTYDAFEHAQKVAGDGAVVNLEKKPGIRTGTF